MTEEKQKQISVDISEELDTEQNKVIGPGFLDITDGQPAQDEESGAKKPLVEFGQESPLVPQDEEAVGGFRRLPAPDLDIPDMGEKSGDISAGKIAVLRKILKNLREQISNALKLIDELEAGKSSIADAENLDSESKPLMEETGDVVEGVFDGKNMVGGDGKIYDVPSNYASKSKLVEGDILKLTITASGRFVYKQIGPVERDRICGKLVFDSASGEYSVMAGSRKWKILKASVTYYKGEIGDEAIILAPKDATSKWAAVENIIKV